MEMASVVLHCHRRAVAVDVVVASSLFLRFNTNLRPENGRFELMKPFAELLCVLNGRKISYFESFYFVL